MASSISILVDEVPLVPPVSIEADGLDWKQITVVTTPATPGAAYSLRSSVPLLLNVPLDGALDEHGELTFRIGPSRLRGSVSCSVAVPGAGNSPFPFSVGYV